MSGGSLPIHSFNMGGTLSAEATRTSSTHYTRDSQGNESYKNNSDEKAKMEQDLEEQTTPLPTPSAPYVGRTMASVFQGLVGALQSLPPQLSWSSQSRTAVVSSSDGSRTSAVQQERRRNGELEDAYHRVEHKPSFDNPDQRTRVWERRFPQN